MKLNKSMNKVLRAIEDSEEPLNAAQIAVLVCLNECTVKRYIREMRNSEKRYLRIAKYTRNLITSGPPKPYYSIANGKKDAARPKPLPNSERSAAWQKRNRYAIQKSIEEGRKLRESKLMRIGPIGEIDPLLAIMMGEQHAAA